MHRTGRLLARLATGLLLLAASAPAEEPIRLTILHSNDIHGQLEPLPPSRATKDRPAGGFAHLAAMVEAVRRECADRNVPVLLLDGGDLFQGTPIGNETRGDSVVDCMNALRYDAVCVGNHEFDYGLGNFLRLARRAEFPFLAANVAGKKAPFGNVKPFVLFGPPRIGCRVAVIGLLSDRTPWMTTPGACDSLEFAPPVEAARALVKRTEADLHILLTHIGEEEDRAIAEAVPEIDLIVGGHSHTVVQERRGVPIVQTGARGLALGRVDLRIDPATFRAAVERMELVPVDPDSTPADPAVAEVIRRHAAGLSETLKKRVGELKAPLRRTRSLHTASAGNWISDVLRARGEAEVAFMNKGGIRVELDPGPVTYEDLYRLMPFDNTIVAMDLSGKALLALLARSMKAGGHPGLEWSGLIVTVGEGEKPAVVAVEAGGAPLDPERIYRVATNSFLAAGGDGFSLFGEGRNVRNSGLLLRDALSEALAKESPLTPPAASRLRVQPAADR